MWHALFAILALAVGTGACVRPEGPEPSGPNVLLVTVDTLRADHVGAYGGVVKTPNLDRLAGEGAMLLHGVTPTPTTGPAHASLFMGLYPWRHGVLDNAVPLVTEERSTLAEVLREQGFSTAAFVSSFVLDPRFLFNRGFDTYEFDPNQMFKFRGEVREAFWTRGEQTANAAMRWLADNADSDRRFFLWVHLFDPHSPYAPPPGHAADLSVPIDMSAKSVPSQVESEAELRRLIRAYRGEVHYADAQVGRILNRLNILGMANDTAVILTSDHGEGLGDHGLLEHGRNVYDELIRVPMMVRAPGIPEGQRLAGPAQLEDLYPTALSLLGVAGPTEGDGVDLTPWLRAELSTSPRSATFGRRKKYSDAPDLYYRRQWPDKWIGELDQSGRVFDLDNDARELSGVANQTLPSDLSAIRAGSGSESERGQALDEETERALKALGYAE